MNPAAEYAAEQEIKKSLKKKTGYDFKVKLEGYTLASMKKGIFKYLEITGKNIEAEGVEVPYANLKTITDYNWVDYTQNPVVYKSNMTFAYNLELSEKSINDALKNEEYQKTLQNVNKLAYPLFTINNVRVRIRHDKVHVIMEYNFPIAPVKKNRTFMVSTGFQVKDGKIQAKDIGIDNAYGNLGVDKVANLVNLLNPLSFTLSLMDTKKCDGKIENVNIVDNIIKVNGKIFVKGD